MSFCPAESFAALDGLPFVKAVFLQRCPEIDVRAERDVALARLSDVHRAVKDEIFGPDCSMVNAEQVHGNRVEAICPPLPSGPVPATDGLITQDRGVCLGIYVADCAAVYIADKRGRCIALLHSGKKGTESGITRVAIRQMAGLGCAPSDLVVQIGPCIRPPHYEIDFATDIVRQAREEGVEDVHDCGLCTASDPERYYSYRREKGRTGRMLALMALI